MVDILDEIVDNKRVEVDVAKQELPLYELAKRVEQFLTGNSLKQRSAVPASKSNGKAKA